MPGSTTSQVSSTSSVTTISTASRVVRPIRHHAVEPGWARAGNGPLYIGPWQEFALSRALNQRPRRGGGASNTFAAPFDPTCSEASSTTSGFSAASSASTRPADGPEELAQFVAAFKEMASTMDEEGARNLLMWSPLFMPTVDNLMKNSSRSMGGPARKPRLKAAMPREVTHPAPNAQADAAAAQRQAHMAKLQALYMAGAVPPRPHETRMPPLHSAPLHSTQTRPGGHGSALTPEMHISAAGSTTSYVDIYPRVTPPRAACASALNAGLNDDWEEEVDDLLTWTTQLPTPDL